MTLQEWLDTGVDIQETTARSLCQITEETDDLGNCYWFDLESNEERGPVVHFSTVCILEDGTAITISCD